MPLAGLMTLRNLALNKLNHIFVHIRGFIISTMRKEDKRRTRQGESQVNNDKLIAMAQEEEGLVEVEMRQMRPSA